MTQPTIDQLAELAKGLVAAAAEKHLTVRVLGGVAVYLACPSITTHASLQRTVKDVDLVAAPQDFDAILQLFAVLGATQRSRNSQQLVLEKDGAEIELTVPDFREDHRIDLTSRLALSSPTVSMADLLLVKLQREKFVEKDIQDSIALLLDHSVAKGEAEGQIDHAYIARLCARDWGLFRTVYDNTVTLEHILDKYLDAEQAQLVWRRIELIQGDMDRQPKSLGWMIHQIIRRPTEVPA